MSINDLNQNKNIDLTRNSKCDIQKIITLILKENPNISDIELFNKLKKKLNVTNNNNKSINLGVFMITLYKIKNII